MCYVGYMGLLNHWRRRREAERRRELEVRVGYLRLVYMGELLKWIEPGTEVFESEMALFERTFAEPMLARGA